MSLQGNIVIPSYETELDEIIKKLPSFETYKEDYTITDSTSYSDKCSDLGTEDNEFKKICEKFMMNINKLTEYKNNLTELKVRSSSLGYWIIDELRNYFVVNNKNIDRGIIDKLIIELNKFSLDSELKHLFFNSDFDFNLAREEKYLHDYFINYDKILSCTDKNCADYYKYVSFIEKIYYKHREDCLGNVCHYFNFHYKYDPDNLLSKLKGRIEGSNKEKENTDPWLGTEGGNPKYSKEKPRMVIKYMLCTEIIDKDRDFHGYTCEDPAYRHNSDRARFISNIKKKKKTSVIGVINSERQPEDSSVLNTQTVQNVNSNVNSEEYEYPDDFVPGVRLYSVNRQLPHFAIESDNSGENGRHRFLTSKTVTLFPEFTDEYREHYVDKDIPKCKIYTRTRGKLACKNTIDANNYGKSTSKNTIESTSMNTIKSTSSVYQVNSDKANEIELMDEIELIDEAESFNEPDGFWSVIRSRTFRSGIVTFLICGVFFVFYIYFKFTPFGDWLSRKLFKKKKVNNYFYEEPMPKQQGHSERPPNGSQNSKRIRIAYQTN